MNILKAAQKAMPSKVFAVFKSEIMESYNDHDDR
jgi:hypothetical protein